MLYDQLKFEHGYYTNKQYSIWVSIDGYSLITIVFEFERRSGKIRILHHGGYCNTRGRGIYHIRQLIRWFVCNPAVLHSDAFVDPYFERPYSVPIR